MRLSDKIIAGPEVNIRRIKMDGEVYLNATDLMRMVQVPDNPDGVYYISAPRLTSALLDLVTNRYDQIPEAKL